jgi:hypothetical protein
MQRAYREENGALALVPGTLVRVQGERLPGRSTGRPRRWGWGAGPDGTQCDPDLAWRAYVRRFDLERTFRFVSQVLGGRVPQVRTPEQADRWTWLIITAYTMLRLARDLVDEHRLPWQPPPPPGQRTPGRVRRGFGHLLARTGSPARPPKPCGRPPAAPKDAAPSRPGGTPPSRGRRNGRPSED